VVNPTWQGSATETERMMKLQDVLLKAMAKKITWWEAAEIIGVNGPDDEKVAGAVGRGRLFGLGGSG